MGDSEPSESFVFDDMNPTTVADQRRENNSLRTTAEDHKYLRRVTSKLIHINMM